MKQTVLTQFIHTLGERHIQFHSAALAFYVVVALPAFIVFFLSIAGLILSGDDIYLWIGMTELMSDAQIARLRTEVLHFSSITAILSALLMVWSGSAIFHRIQQGLRDMWYIRLDVGTGLHRFLAGKLLAIILSLIFMIAIVSLFLLTQLASLLITFVGDILPYSVPSILPIAQLVQFVLTLFVVTVAFALFGDARVSWQLSVFGGTIVSLAYMVLQVGFQTYLTSLAAVTWYGAAGSIILLLLFVYIMGIVFYATAVGMYVVSEGDLPYHITPRSYARHIGNATSGWFTNLIHVIKKYI